MKFPAKLKGKKRWVAIASAAIVIVLVVLIVFRSCSPSRGEAADMLSDVRSSTATTGSISNTVSGSGTLAGADAESVTVPEGVEIDTIYVEAGDQVSEGDTLATVDKTSVLTTLADVQQQIESLDEQIEDTKDDTISSTITTGASGRVKKIYVKKGSDVNSVTTKKGALILISLDGKMAVDLDGVDGVGEGDSVTVTLSSGTTKKGTVAQKTADGVTVTVSDNGTEYGDKVTVTDAEGKELGTGKLYINSELKITGYAGTVSSVKVSENDKVSAGDTLIKLTDLGHTAEYEALLAQRADLAEQMQTLAALNQNNTITAPFDGTIQSVEAESDSSTSQSSSQSGGTQLVSNSTSSSGGFTALSAGAQESETQPSASVEDTEKEQSSEVTPATVNLISLVQLEGASIADYNGVFTLVLSGEGTSQKKTNDKDGKVAFDALTFDKAGSYIYRIYQTGNDSAIQYDTTIRTITINVTSGEDGALIAELVPDEESLTFTNKVNSASSSQSQSGGSSGDSNSSSSNSESVSASAGSSSAASVSSDGSGSSVASSSSDVNTDDSTTTTDTGTGVSSSTVLTISPNDKMTVSVSVDELDILSIKKEQEATVTIDAIEDETFTGTVTGINTSGSSSGGVTKYTVQISIDKTEEMLTNMNASIEIAIDQVDDCVIIPEAALNQSGNRTFVYTVYDESDGTLSGETEVTTGVSDGTNVQIVSGISEGDTVYYNYTEASSSEEEMAFGGMGGGMIGGDGSGGNGGMPGGDSGGGGAPDMRG